MHLNTTVASLFPERARPKFKKSGTLKGLFDCSNAATSEIRCEQAINRQSKRLL